MHMLMHRHIEKWEKSKVETVFSDSGRSCKFGGDSVFQPAGSRYFSHLFECKWAKDFTNRWHPYIPPFGFCRCAVCTCKVRYMCHCDDDDNNNDDDVEWEVRIWVRWDLSPLFSSLSTSFQNRANPNKGSLTNTPLSLTDWPGSERFRRFQTFQTQL